MRLVKEGATSRATKILDREMITTSASDQEILEKLEKLHPKHPCTFTLPLDAPAMACISPEELRLAGRRLAKGSSPGPTGMNDVILRLKKKFSVC